MLNKKLLAKYNQPDTLMVISLYPKKGEVYTAGESGVASYSKNVVSNLTRPVVVLANYDKKPSIYEENNTLVIRCFKSKQVGMWNQLAAEVKEFSAVKNILIQFDFSLYGSIIVSSSLLWFLFLMRIMGKKTSVVSHHVITDVTKLSGHVGLKNTFIDRIKGKIYNSVFYMFYLMLGLLVDKVFILEETLKNRLTKVIQSHKIIVTPHAVDTNLPKMSKSAARKLLGIPENEKVVMFFGFVNWFKGADFFTDAFKDTDKLLNQPARFILAGGSSPTMADKSFYQELFAKVEKNVTDSKALTMTGYVPQEMIKAYFSAADLVVFPYRYYMCASGVLSLVFSYEKPFILSNNLSEMLESPDLISAMNQVDLKKSDMLFALNPEATIAATEKVLKNGLKKKMIKMAQIIGRERNFANSAMLYDSALFNEPVSLSEASLSYVK